MTQRAQTSSRCILFFFLQLLLFTVRFIWVNLFSPFLLMQYATSPLSTIRHTATRHTLLPLIHLVLLKPLFVHLEEAGNYEKQNGKSCERNDNVSCFAPTPRTNFFFFSPNPDVGALDRNCTQGQIRLTSSILSNLKMEKVMKVHGISETFKAFKTER